MLGSNPYTVSISALADRRSNHSVRSRPQLENCLYSPRKEPEAEQEKVKGLNEKIRGLFSESWAEAGNQKGGWS
jgi:hypothetical protein